MEFTPALESGLDEHRPSLLELLSEQQLSSLLAPSLRYVLTVAAQRYPRYLLRPLNWFDELYGLLSLAVERHYLRTRSASFTEDFYGLRRERAPRSEAARARAAVPDAVRTALALRPGDVWRALAVLVLIPYLRRRLEAAYDAEAPRARLGLAYVQLPEQATVRQRLSHYARWFLRNVYPSVQAAYYFGLISFQLAYMFGRSSCHSPLDWLISVRLRRLTAADVRVSQAAAAAASSRSILTRLLSSFSILVPLSVFSLKFLEWWHASDFASQLSRRTAEQIELPAPLVSGLDHVVAGATATFSAPPEESSKVPDDSKVGVEVDQEEASEREIAPVAASSRLSILTVPPPADSCLCPICRAEIATATACQTGFVFCYGCIHRWIEGTHPKQEAFMATPGRHSRWENGRGRCAVTGRRVLGGTDGLRRIMV